MPKQMNSAKPTEGTTPKLTVPLPADLAAKLEAERQRAERVSGYRPSMAQVGERLLRRALENTAATAA